MEIKNVKIGTIGSVIGAVALGASAIVAECRRRKVKRQLLDAQLELAVDNFVDVIKDAHIKNLEKEIQDLKSGCKEKES